MDASDLHTRLTSWLATQMLQCDELRIEELNRVEFGHSLKLLFSFLRSHN